MKMVVWIISIHEYSKNEKFNFKLFLLPKITSVHLRLYKRENNCN
jgi:hypothetical protein